MCFKIIIPIVTKVFIFKVSIAITNLEIWFSQHNLMSNLVISISASLFCFLNLKLP